MEQSNHVTELNRIASGLKNRTFPKIFAVELCADCNLQCTMCFHDKMKRPKGNLPMPLWQKSAAEIAEVAPATNVWFSFCGEPLMLPDRLVEMLKYGEKVGLTSLNLNTNGMLLTNEVAMKLLDTSLSTIVIGIDGFKPDTYKKYRYPGDRDTVYANVEVLLKERQRRDRGPEIMVQFIEMEDNAAEYQQYRDHWLGLGATVKFRRMLSWGGKFETGIEVDEDQRIPCPWAMTMMHLFWDGRVPRCPGDMEGEEGAGNAWDDSLVDLWANLSHYRRHHLKHDFDALPERCHTCTDWKTGASEKLRPPRRTSATA